MRQLNFLYLLGQLCLSKWDNNEIRYSLRSIDAAFDVNWVGITGPEKPAFLTGVTHIPVVLDQFSRYKNMQKQLLAACQREDTPEELILMNDDFMVRPAPLWDWTPTHRGPITKELKGNGWQQSVVRTGLWCNARGIENPLSYEGHTPMPFLKSKAVPILEALLQNEESLQFRTAYGNLNAVGGNFHHNAKRRDPAEWPADSPFWSLKGTVNEKAKTFLQNWLSRPSQWEVQNAS